jgi:glucose-fructose oxidoreductase
LVSAHPNAEICGISDEEPARMESTSKALSIPPERVFTDYRKCLQETKPDIVILCSSTATHADWVEKIAPFGPHILVEKPFAATLEEADRMIAATQESGKTMVINWPIAWYPPHVASKRLIEEGVIGDVLEVHHYGGNRGPLHHLADKVEVSEEEVARRKGESWWYQKDKGGGSLLDYLGYGTTLGTWFHGGRAPIEVTCTIDQPRGLEVDEHSVTVARYENGLSKFETRWGTFTDPWIHQPQPKCGFVIVGSKGTISSYEYENTLRVQTREHPEGETVPVDALPEGRRNPIEYLIGCLESGEKVSGPLSPELSRIGQQIIDSAVQSAREKRTVPLVD